jgi:hypothetical protein
MAEVDAIDEHLCSLGPPTLHATFSLIALHGIIGAPQCGEQVGASDRSTEGDERQCRT